MRTLLCLRSEFKKNSCFLLTSIGVHLKRVFKKPWPLGSLAGWPVGQLASCRTRLKPPFQFHHPLGSLGLEKVSKKIFFKRVRALHQHGALQALLRTLMPVMSELGIAFSQEQNSQCLLSMQLLGALRVYIFDI